MARQGKGRHKFGKVMGEFKRGTLRSSSGQLVTSLSQARAIGFSEARDVAPSYGKKKKRKRRGGY